MTRFILAACALFMATTAAAQTTRPTLADVLKASQPADWRSLDPARTLYLELPAGRVIIELHPKLAPKHVANILALAKEGWYDGNAIIRSHDNYVAQWGDPTEKKEVKTAKRKLDGEFTTPVGKDFAFDKLPDADGYAPQVGFSSSFPVGRDAKAGTAWLAHCYGMVGVGRGNETNSGDGTSLYAVTGHAPRHLDRNITVVGRVVQGMPLLSSLPRGTGNLGFYEKPEQHVPIKAVRIAADVPAAERTNLEVLRTDTATFTKAVEALRNRGGDWFKVPAGYIELCNVQVPVRVAAK
ncbi:MAG: peptidylprolyl isomerase [Burkholderiales bacterium]|nr:peptidylprolyl isomerase [Burkholderiales bacterium]